MYKRLSILAVITLVAACDAPAPPSSPPQLTTPPPVATDGFLTVTLARTVPMDVSELRSFMTEQPLTSFLEPTENIANPVASEVLTGTWPDPGSARWLRLADGHYIIERVLENAPTFFKYQVFVFTNAVGRGVEQIVGEQRFTPVDGGTEFVWTYNVRPTNFVTRQFVRRNLPEIERYLSGGLDRFTAAARADVQG